MPIPDEKIEEIRAAADIVDVAGDYVQLKQSGSRFKGLCPFHSEKTPSFSVDPDQNLYYCFGCQNGGDVFKFIQEIEGVGFLESARILAERYGIPIPEGDVDPEEATERETILHALRFAARFFYHQLTQTDRGRPALEYLRGRGFKPRTIKRFGLGYAPDSWDALLTAAKNDQIDPETLEKAGLVVERNSGNGYYDRYRGRVIFPIFSHIGKVLGFAGRILDPDADQPKYINSPETKVYHKSDVLYGLHQAKRAIREEDEVLMVEGYTDVISLSQEGIGNVVASSGTSLTEGQVETLDRYAKRVLLLYDADEAGARAAVRGLDLVLEQGMAGYAVELPDGSDPDDYVHEQGGEAFRAYVDDNRQDLPTFIHRRAQRTGQLQTPEDRVEVQREVMASIARIPDPNLRREYVVRASEVLGVPDTDLFRILDEELEKRRKQEERRARREKYREQRDGAQGDGAQGSQEAGGTQGGGGGNGAEGGAGRPVPPPGAREGDGAAASAEDDDLAPPEGDPLEQERLLLRLMLEEGEPMIEFILGNMALDEFTDGLAREMAGAIVEIYRGDGRFDAQPILDGEHGSDLQNLAASVMVNEHEPSANWVERRDITPPRYNEDAQHAAESAMKLLKDARVVSYREHMRSKLFEAQKSGNWDRALRLSREISQLNDLRKRIQDGEFFRKGAEQA
jgi:DNA primase